MLTCLFTVTDRVLRSVAFTGIGLMGLAITVTLADIALRGTVGQSIRGTVDITQLGLIICAALVIPFAFLRDAHVRVDIGVSLIPVRLRHAMDGVGALLGALLMAAILWAGAGTALQALDYGDVSQTIGIPMPLFWAFFLAGAALSVLACLLLAARDLAVAAGITPAPSRSQDMLS